MTEEQVKKHLWNCFQEWIRGQETGIREGTGEKVYYLEDIAKFFAGAMRVEK